MSGEQLFVCPKHAGGRRFTLRYFDEEWHELSDLRYSGADMNGILTGVYQWLIVQALPDVADGKTAILRDVTHLSMEVSYD